MGKHAFGVLHGTWAAFRDMAVVHTPYELIADSNFSPIPMDLLG